MWRFIVLSLALFGVSLGAKRKGAEFIKQFEKLKLNAYPDQAGNMTIGYGHKMSPGDPVSIDVGRADQLFLLDYQNAASVVDDSVNVSMTSGMRDALVSLVFNIGSSNFIQSSLLQKMNTGDYVGAAGEFLRWVYITLPDGGKQISSGLQSRRAAEQNLFVS